MNKQLSALLEEPYGQFRKFISVADFECLVHKITPYIERKDTNFRTSIPARLRFAVTLHYLLTGDSYSSLQLIYKISKQSLSRIIPDVCNALNDVLKDEVQVISRFTFLFYLLTCSFESFKFIGFMTTYSFVVCSIFI